MSWAFEEVVESCLREGVVVNARDVRGDGVNCCLLLAAAGSDVVVRQLAQM